MGRFADLSGYSENENAFWESLKECEGFSFCTARGLEFRFRIVGNELFIDRKEKSITRSSVMLAYGRLLN